MKNKEQPLTDKRIGVFGKGGAGKSTVVVLLATALQERGYKVCVLDADSTNLGLPLALGVDVPQKTLLDYYGGMIFSGGQVTCPVDDPTTLENAEISLDDLSKKYFARSKEGIAFLSAGKIGTQGPGAGCDGPVTKIARDLRIHSQDEPLVTLVDFKAGFEDTARGAITSLDWAIVVVDPTSSSVEIAADMKAMVNQIKADVLPATSHLESPELVTLANKIFTQAIIKDVWFVLNKVPNGEVEAYLRQRLSEKRIQPIGVIHETPSISLSWLKGEPLETADVRAEALNLIDAIEQRAGKVSRKIIWQSVRY
jgi:CO dehydrogenase maturation factor